MPFTYEPIATTTLGSAATTIDFSSIAGSFTDLRIVLVGVQNQTGSGGIRYNSDTGSNYSVTYIDGNGATASSTRFTSTTSITAFYSGSITTRVLREIDIFSYAGSTNKTCLISESSDINGGGGYVIRRVGLWSNTAAITSISLICGGGGQWTAGTTATLYGILRA